MRTTNGAFNGATRPAQNQPISIPTTARGKGSWWRAALLAAAVAGGAEPAAGATSDVRYAGHAGAHNLYVLNADGNLFRWGEPRYGQYAGERSPAMIPYYESMIAVPPSPSGARWKAATGWFDAELFLDEAGRVFTSQLAMNLPTQLIEITHPDPARAWRQMAAFGAQAALLDDVGELFELQLHGLLYWVATHPDAGPPPVDLWLEKIAGPSSSDAIIEVVRSGAILVRTASGEIFGHGYDSFGLTGSEYLDTGDWRRVLRPAGVGAWQSFRVSQTSAVALGDDGHAYYWGLRIPGSVAADPAADERVPARIELPAGISGWNSVGVSGTLVLLGAREGGLYGFGVTDSNSQTFGSGNPLLVAATRSDDPLLQGTIEDVIGGSDYVIVRRSDGIDVRWGQFMRLEGAWFPGWLPPGEVALPVTVTELPQRLAPSARLLTPTGFDHVPLGEPVTLSAEVFALDGALASARFLVNHNLLPGIPQRSGNLATLSWTTTAPGEHGVQVLATDAAGRTNLSAVVPFSTRHAVRWTVSTNRISELTGGIGGAPDSSAEILITRTELPYPNYHPFTYRFRIWPLPLLGKDFTIDGATLLADGSAYWEVRFAPGQKTATVRITALEDVFTEPDLYLHLEPAYDWAKEQDFLNPSEPLALVIEDATPTGGSSPVFIIDRLETRFSFLGDTLPVAVSVPKSLVELPVVQLLTTSEMYLPHFLDSIEDLPDRRVYHFSLYQLPAGLHELTARVRDGTDFAYDRYVDSLPVPARVWDPAGLTTVRVVASEQTVNEADEPTWTFTLMREGSLSEAIEVGLAVRGTAIGGSDYDELPVSVTLPAGIGYVQIMLRIHDDTRAEFDETITISARQHPCEQLAGCAVALTDSALRVRIRDDDSEAPVAGGARVVASPFSDGSYLVTASGQLYAWGDNQQGRLGLGELPPELAERVPWPRRLRGLADGERWQRVLVGPEQAFGVSDQGKLLAWGTGFAGYNQVFGIPTPSPVTAPAGDAEPFYVRDGALIFRPASGRLQTYRVTSYLPHQLYAPGEEGLLANLVTPQLRVLSDEGYFHEATDWQGLYADRYPLAPGAGYWRDVASAGGAMIALDELDRLFRVHGGDIHYDPVLGRTRRYYTTEALPALPAGRTVSQLFGNELGILALATDGTAFSLHAVTNGQPAAPASLISFPAGVSRWTSLAAGRGHFLAVGDDGRVYSWGANTAGQLGDGTTEPVDLPRALPAFAGVNDPAVEFPIVDLARPPVASLYAMEAAYHLGGPETIRASARAYDPDGLIERVEFLLNGEVAAVATFDFALRAFVADVFVPHPGDYVLTARAWDDAELSGDSEGIAIHVDDPGLYPVVKVWNIPSGTAEGYGFPGYFVISRQGIADVPLTVYFDIVGTATEGTDYPALPRSVVIPAGAAEVRLPVIARPDFIDEDTEEINLTILNPGCDPDTAEPGSGCYRIAEPASAPVFILDYLRPGDAFLPFVSLRLVNSPIIREGMTNVAVIEARRYGVVVEDLAVHYDVGGTAENGVDYQPLSGVVVIPAGADRATFSITAIEDIVTEPFERIFLTVADSGCGVTGGSAEGCYLSDPNNSLVVFVGERVIFPPLPNSVPRPVLFDDVVLFPGEGALLSVMSDPGAVFVLEVSADLVNWEPLSELTSGNGRVEFFDVDAATAGRRFYRLVAPPDP